MVFIYNSYHLVISFFAHNTNDYITNYQILFLVDILVKCLDILLSGNCFYKQIPETSLNKRNSSRGQIRRIYLYNLYDITPVDEFV